MIQFSKPTVEQFFRTFVITDFTVNKEESRLIFSSNIDGKVNLWAMDLPDQFPYLFAHRDQSVNFIKFDPENRYVLTGYDQDGDENYQIYGLPIDGGLPQSVVCGAEDEKFYFAHLSEDGERLYYDTSRGNPSFLNTHVYHLTNQTDELLNEGQQAPTQLGAVSDDEQSFVYFQMFANTYVTAFVKQGENKHYLTPNHEEIHVCYNALFTNSETIYFVTNYQSEYNYVAKYDLTTQTFNEVLKFAQESVEDIKYDKDQNALYLVTEKGVEDLLYRFDLGAEQLTQLDCPVAVIEKIHVAESGQLYLLGRSATAPLNIFQSKDGLAWQSLTNNRVLGISEADMVEPDVVKYTSFDGLEIEALLFKAKPELANGHTIFWPHGGPQAAERKMFRAMFQAFLNRGYTIFAPNFRGSTGYGASFVKMVEQDWGEGPRLDNLAGLDWLIEQNLTDPDHLFLVGGSYGGYMALLLHGRHPDYFKAVIDIFGPSDLFTFVNSVPDHWKPMMERWLGDPERDKDRFIKDSPVTYLDGMTRPMLVIQGAKDPRVVQAESDQIVAKLKEQGREVDYLVLEDEGHGFSKKENEIKVYSMMLDFLAKHQTD
ncbi:Dipeptidyl aminopeptidase/acylaminoacyl peptidase [Amphibacillus marinus]|uniref:Dipeptidyl aminopeptidase/acylaminoacyl peptidase n=1 Tax=Amphibacillus marinus TaxID=872970 RepID=A0A1H8L235_9BACI|nr:S9 family peptidase [Amphibacillus marinus]SEN99204.1 Dipeptidyl aminopeptidase/acylaminoacyl peptidase [Amphibacillus marinus]